MTIDTKEFHAILGPLMMAYRDGENTDEREAALIAHIDAQLSAVRSAALEEAAHICEAYCACDNGEDDEETNRMLRNRAAQIRDRINRPAAPSVSEQDERALFITAYRLWAQKAHPDAHPEMVHFQAESHWGRAAGAMWLAARAQGAQAEHGVDMKAMWTESSQDLAFVAEIEQQSREVQEIAAQAAQSEGECTDGGKCGVGGYCKDCRYTGAQATQGSGVQREPVAWMTQWLRDNYQDYQNIALLCDAMRDAWAKQKQQPASEWKCPTCGQGQRFDHRGCRPFGWWNAKYHLFTPASQISSGEPVEHSPAYVGGELIPLYAAHPAPSAAPAQGDALNNLLAERRKAIVAADGRRLALVEKQIIAHVAIEAAAPAQVAQGEPVAIHQWRMKRPDEAWHDATKEEAYSRVDEFYEARTVYAAPVEPSQQDKARRKLVECPTCGLDRLTSPCGNPSNCGMIGVAHQASTQEGGAA